MKRIFIYLSTIAAGVASYLSFKKQKELEALQLLQFEYKHIGLEEIKPEAVYLSLQFAFANASPYSFMARGLVIKLSYKGTVFATSEKNLFYLEPNKTALADFIIGVPYQEFIRVISGAWNDKEPLITADVKLRYYSQTLGFEIPVELQEVINVKQLATNYFESWSKQ
jgi:hypothetical protein